MKMANLGCGNRFHEDWINLDFKSNSDKVIEYNLLEKLPFEDNSVDVVYTSHVLEHFSKCDAPKFLDECYRVLKQNGIIRVVVPDLEQLMKNYIKFLSGAKKGDVDSQEKYEWTMIELFDQMVRNYSGGEMLNYWKQAPMPQEDFVIKRLGSEVTNALKSIRSNSKKNFSDENINLKAEEIGKFRTSGEIHQWMYDELSLGKLLEYTGFKDIKVKQSNESNINNFNSYLLDIEKNGTTRKPDSLFMEAKK
jgi:predicted SAM-dependent methyltransferase